MRSTEATVTGLRHGARPDATVAGVLGPEERVTVALALAADRVAADTTRALRAGGVDSILLKGASLAEWLYADGTPRGYADVDLLVDPRRHAGAEAVLGELGFAPLEADDWEGSEYQPHARPWRRADDGAIIDLHRTLADVRNRGPESVWAVLQPHREQMMIGGAAIDVLDIPGRLALCGLHAAHHGLQLPKPLEDLRRAIAVADDASWRAAVSLADELDALHAFATGLRLVPEGDALADHLGLWTPDLLATSQGGDPAPLAIGFERLASAPRLRDKLALLGRELVPNPSAVRYSSRLARRGRIGLALAYLRRPFWLARHAPASYRAWRRFRRPPAPRG